MSLTPYTEPVREESEQYKPIENTGKVLIVNVKEYKTGIVTSNSPDGGPGVIVDLVDIDAAPSKVYRNVLWMGGAIVDGLKPRVGGEPVMIKFEKKKAASGRVYPNPVPLDDVSSKRALAWFESNGDMLTAAAAQDDAEPPF